MITNIKKILPSKGQAFSLSKIGVLTSVLFLGLISLGGSSVTTAMLNSSLTAENALIGPDIPDEELICEPGEQVLADVVEFDQGNLKSGLPVTDPNRTDATDVLGAADGDFYSLGYGGSITAQFPAYILDTTGDDLIIHELTNGRASYPEELALVEVSQDGLSWTAFAAPASSKAVDGNTYYDLAELGLPWISYVRVTDQTNSALHSNSSDGFDLDAIFAYEGVCTEPAAEQVVSGMKYHDLDRDGQVDDGEAGLGEWRIVAATKMTEFEVAAQDTPAVESPVLAAGTTYVARVTGTYDANDSITSDAKYSVRTPNTEWTDYVQNYEGYGPTLLDLQIDGSSPDWGPYNTDHTYWVMLNGADAAKSFEIYDLNNGSNNSGALTVEIFQVVDEDLTDDAGNYELTVPTDQTVYLFEELQAGWSQTQPGSTDYLYVVSPEQSVYNFGNALSVTEVACTTISGQKTNALTGQGLANWPVVVHPLSSTPVETVTLAANDVDGETLSTMMDAGRTYLIEVSGTWTNKSSRVVDADYWSDDNWNSINDFDADLSRDVKQLDVIMNEADVDWQSYNADHTYYSVQTGIAGQPTLRIYDGDHDGSPPSWYNDNVGSLTIKLYDVTDMTTQTDGSGNYAQEICQADTYRVVEAARAGWETTSPDQPSYHTLTYPGELAGSYSFANTPAIVLNEILANPVTPDDGSMPDGEWVELFNNSRSDVDVAGWTITSNSGSLTIDTGNSDSDLDPFDGGETVVPAGGSLVVYRNGDADFSLDERSGDTVTLFNLSGTRYDQHSFVGGVADDKTQARIPDGTGSWVDPFARPTRSNTDTAGDLTPSAKFWFPAENEGLVGLYDAVNYTTVTITITYTRDQDGERVAEAIQKTVGITENNQYIDGFYFGSVSGENGENKYPHQDINDIVIQVQLSGDGIPERMDSFAVN